ncbi:hypothetical protein MBLNU230_g2208t1 [Neophaeotheca triangularis]
MAYLFYTIVFVLLIFASVLYFTRETWRPLAPPIPYLTAPGTIPAPLYDLSQRLSNFTDSFRYSRLPTTFAGDAESGLQSSNFNLSENIEAGDSRGGLDEAGKREVLSIMRRRGCTFDEARREFVEERFGREGIGRDGRPLDRKAVMFS